MEVTAQILGGCAIVCWIISVQQKEKKDVLLCQIFANGLYSIQYFLLGVYSAVSMTLLSCVRSILFYFFPKKNVGVFVLFFALIFLFGILTYQSVFHLIPIIITVFYAYALWQDNLTITRFIFISAAIVWIFYNFQVGAYTNVVGNILEILMSVITLVQSSHKVRP